ncbi:MAG: dTDP-4-dehydrorhamnose reductase [Ruminococcaceae bacterium]|nr:dTDP-4-dehydrorhamnose reductase [Oscillospiraceae bacterium]
MKILVTGSNGQLGSELINRLNDNERKPGNLPVSLINSEVLGIDIDVLDITDEVKVREFVQNGRFDCVINCAAFTNVDKAEESIEQATAVNTTAPGFLAKVASETGAKFIHISTDYVFSGEGDIPFKENDVKKPNTVYGKTKLAGEDLVLSNNSDSLIVRTAWLYGYRGRNFVKTIVNLAKERDIITVVNDQFGNPTNAADLAQSILMLTSIGAKGIYHCTNSGICSWYEFAKEIVGLSRLDSKVVPCTTEEFPSPAKRPKFSALDNSKLEKTLGIKMRSWQEAIKEYLENSDKYTD